MADQDETKQLLFRVMMDLQSYLIALNTHDFQSMKMWEHNLRQHVLFYRTMLENEAQQEDASNGYS